MKPTDRAWSCFLLTACLVSLSAAYQAGAQDAAPPSVADAANSARQRKKSTAPARALSDEDLGSEIEGQSGGLLNDQQVRAIIQKDFPHILNAQSAKQLVDSAELIAFSYGSADIVARSYQVGELRDYWDVPFPGRGEWEVKFHDALEHLATEAKLLPQAIRSIENEDPSLIAGGSGSPDAAQRLEQVRNQLIEATIPLTRWYARTPDLIEDAKKRAKAYLANSQLAMAQYRQGRVPLAEEGVGSGMIWLGRAEKEYRKAYGRYTCDLQDFKFGSKPGPHSANLLSTNLTAYQDYDYDLTLEGCDASQGQHYRTVATAPSPDGTQGHSFCSDDSGTVRMASDGKADSCLSHGQPWQPKSWKP